MRQANLDLTIDELVLHGMTDLNHAEIGAAIERELAQVIAEGGIPSAFARDGHVSDVDGGAMEMSSGVDAAAIGAQIARAVYGSANR